MLALSLIILQIPLMTSSNRWWLPACAAVVAVLMLAWHNIWMASHGKELAAQAKLVARSVASGSTGGLGRARSGIGTKHEMPESRYSSSLVPNTSMR